MDSGVIEGGLNVTLTIRLLMHGKVRSPISCLWRHTNRLWHNIYRNKGSQRMYEGQGLLMWWLSKAIDSVMWSCTSKQKYMWHWTGKLDSFCLNIDMFLFAATLLLFGYTPIKHLYPFYLQNCGGGSLPCIRLWMVTVQMISPNHFNTSITW